MERIDHLIDGKRTEGGARTSPVHDPATGERTAEVCLADVGPRTVSEPCRSL